MYHHLINEMLRQSDSGSQEQIKMKMIKIKQMRKLLLEKD